MQLSKGTEKYGETSIYNADMGELHDPYSICGSKYGHVGERY